MKLKSLFKTTDVTIKGDQEIEITGISSNSKQILPGNLFIARKGQKYDEGEFIQEAAINGASAILCSTYNPFLEGVAQVLHENVGSIAADIAARYYHYPSQKMTCIGITGTCGKTTTSYLVSHLLNSLNQKCALLGTIEGVIGERRFPSALTTPDAVTCQRFLSDALKEHCKAISMEVSSHALDQGRVKHIDFDVAIFTNLTSDHLDYHETVQNYAEAKSKLFLSLGGKRGATAVINIDSPFAGMMIESSRFIPIITYGLEQKGDLSVKEVKFLPSHTELVLQFQGEKVSFSSPLIGRFNAYNLLASIAAILALGFKLKQLPSLVSTFAQVQGRLERVCNKNIFVDFAHTEDALLNVLKTLHEIKQGKIITVFGCGGDRDKSKRPKMGRVASAFSDEVIVTSDNPRSEDPKKICEEIIVGIENGNYSVEVDRKEAIKKAILKMKGGDIVLIAGRGHECYQIFNNKKISFDDRKVAEEIALQC